MVPITRDEKILLQKKYPNLCVARTMKQDSKRKHYYCEERVGAMAYLNEIRQMGVVYDSSWKNGKPQPKKDERKSWKQNGKKNDRQDRSGGRR